MRSRRRMPGQVHTVSDASRRAFLGRIADTFGPPPPPPRELIRLEASELSNAASDDEDDEEEEELGETLGSSSSVAAAPRVVERAAPPEPTTQPVNCPLCHEELPFIGDAATRDTMNERMNDLRAVIFRFERLLVGRVHDDIVFSGMLAMRRLLIERHLEAYSRARFRRWTMPMLREHYHPRTGHRYDYVRALDAEIKDLALVNTWIMDEGMFVIHPDTHERVFNLRAVRDRLQASKTYIDALKTKEAALRLSSATSIVDTAAIIDAVTNASALVTSATSRKRSRDADTAVARLHDLGGM